VQLRTGGGRKDSQKKKESLLRGESININITMKYLRLYAMKYPRNLYIEAIFFISGQKKIVPKFPVCGGEGSNQHKIFRISHAKSLVGGGRLSTQSDRPTSTLVFFQKRRKGHISLTSGGGYLLSIS